MSIITQMQKILFWKKRNGLLILLILLFSAACSHNAGKNRKVQGSTALILQGSTTLLPVIQRAAEVYAPTHKRYKISVRGGGSGNGIAALLDGIANIAMASRPISPAEITISRRAGLKIKETVIAKDGIVVIVNNRNPISDISLSDLRKIYQGVFKNWSEFGRYKVKIIVVSRDSASGTFEVFKRIVMGKANIVASSLEQVSNNMVRKIVSQTPGAIGYIGLGYLNKAVKPVKVGGIKASAVNVNNGKYRISRPLFLYTTEALDTGAVKDFIGYCLSDSGQKIVKEKGYIPIR